MAPNRLEVRPIGADDVDRVAEFLHTELNPRVPTASWRTLLDPPWGATGPNRGFQLLADGEVVGAYAAVYSTRPGADGADGAVAVVNLAAFCVRDDHRAHSFRLLRALLKQPDLEFTDLSPSGNVVALNERLGFARLDTTTRLTVNIPALPPRGVRVTDDPQRIAATLRGRDADIHADHRRAPAAHHVLVTEGDRYAYLIVRRDRRKGLALFATPLHASGDRELLRRAWPAVGAHLLRRLGTPVALAERRVLGFAPRLGVALRTPRVKMHRGHRLRADEIDDLYSELTLIEW